MAFRNNKIIIKMPCVVHPMMRWKWNSLEILLAPQESKKFVQTRRIIWNTSRWNEIKKVNIKCLRRRNNNYFSDPKRFMNWREVPTKAIECVWVSASWEICREKEKRNISVGTFFSSQPLKIFSWWRNWEMGFAEMRNFLFFI